MSNTLFVLLDGAEDDPIPEFDGKKPLDVARMPFLHSKARHKMYTTGRGYTHLFLNEFFSGRPPEMSRGALEAYGFGLRMGPGRVAYRLTPARIAGVDLRWAYDSEGFADELESRVRENLHMLEDPDVRFYMGGKAVLTFKGDCPEPDGFPVPPKDGPYRRFPGELGELVDKVAREMGGVTDYPWGGGSPGRGGRSFPCLGRMTAISNGPVALGIAASLGHDIMLVDDIEARFPAARDALETGNVFLHLDEVDEYSHQKDPGKKVRVLELIDRLMCEHFSDVEDIVISWTTGPPASRVSTY
jgi:2,3-bisphosphoglycerate-independent phosphoglycerate mutase